MSNLDMRDKILQAHTPTVMVPRFGELPRLDQNGHRFLAAQDGLWLEVYRPWLYLRTPIGFVDIDLPYGKLEHCVEYAFTAEQIEEVQEMFARTAREAMPNECAAWAIWDASANELVYRPLLAIHASQVLVEFHRPDLAPHEHLAIDIHSHGALPPEFSSQDDDDDRGEVKFSVVGGHFDRRSPVFASRLCAHGIFLESQ